MRTIRFLLTLAAAALLLAAAAADGRAAPLYGITFSDQLITIDPATGAGTLVGKLDTSMLGYGLAVTNGNLYTYDQVAERVRQLDPATGHTLATININTPTLVGEGDIEFRADGTGFLASASGSVFLSFDIASGTSHTISTLQAPVFDGLAFDGNGVLYGLSQGVSEIGGSKLYTINPATGAATLVGALNVPAAATEILGGLAFAPDGALYAELSNGSTTSGLYAVDKAIGQATLVGLTAGFGNVSGIRFLAPASPPPPAVPEPSSLAFCALGGLALAGWRWRRRGTRATA